MQNKNSIKSNNNKPFIWNLFFGALALMIAILLLAATCVLISNFFGCANLTILTSKFGNVGSTLIAGALCIGFGIIAKNTFSEGIKEYKAQNFAL